MKMETLKYLVYLLIIVFGHNFKAKAQEIPTAMIQNEINDQIWSPFKKAFSDRDWNLFNSIHADDILRINKWGIRKGSEYKNSIETSYSQNSSTKRSIDFCFSERITNSSTSYEVGLYKITSQKDQGDIHYSYAQFHVLLKKINNRWKIVQYWDSDLIHGNKITKEMFNECKSTSPYEVE
ncbi:nuclear transport factor 2 family protein [Zhouia amylolytica]|uniref:DUF4440 domain-containing protein n=1 Tax=Zhouia amylolytica AD3 TaxID=1286632 RepID=W2UPL6_9FLAO|nr:nuclear transport factor 2 family protein [Zhouia amylolytica]ETN95884.1 hypothetical protein P278_16060 [Zhouia amylolytica AD3]